jgi:hypothetical protein
MEVKLESVSPTAGSAAAAAAAGFYGASKAAKPLVTPRPFGSGKGDVGAVQPGSNTQGAAEERDAERPNTDVA